MSSSQLSSSSNEKIYSGQIPKLEEKEENDSFNSKLKHSCSNLSSISTSSSFAFKSFESYNQIEKSSSLEYSSDKEELVNKSIITLSDFNNDRDVKCQNRLNSTIVISSDDDYDYEEKIEDDQIKFYKLDHSIVNCSLSIHSSDFELPSFSEFLDKQQPKSTIKKTFGKSFSMVNMQCFNDDISEEQTYSVTQQPFSSQVTYLDDQEMRHAVGGESAVSPDVEKYLIIDHYARLINEYKDKN